MDMSSEVAPWNSSWNRIGSTEMPLIREEQSAGMFAYTQLPQKFEKKYCYLHYNRETSAGLMFPAYLLRREQKIQTAASFVFHSP